MPVKDKPIKFNFLNKDQFVEKFFEISSKKSTNNALYGLSFAESIFFPIPIDPLLAACVISKPKKIFLITFLTTFKLILVIALFHTTLYAEDIKVFEFTEKELSELEHKIGSVPQS